MPSRLIDISLVATVLIISTLMATTAHANMVFRNLTGQTVHFDITCNDGVIDGWNRSACVAEHLLQQRLAGCQGSHSNQPR
jgi:hypothetical protein